MSIHSPYSSTDVARNTLYGAAAVPVSTALSTAATGIARGASLPQAGRFLASGEGLGSIFTNPINPLSVALLGQQLYKGYSGRKTAERVLTGTDNIIGAVEFMDLT